MSAPVIIPLRSDMQKSVDSDAAIRVYWRTDTFPVVGGPSARLLVSDSLQKQVIVADSDYFPPSPFLLTYDVTTSEDPPYNLVSDIVYRADPADTIDGFSIEAVGAARIRQVDLTDAKGPAYIQAGYEIYGISTEVYPWEKTNAVIGFPVIVDNISCTALWSSGDPRVAGFGNYVERRMGGSSDALVAEGMLFGLVHRDRDINALYSVGGLRTGIEIVGATWTVKASGTALATGSMSPSKLEAQISVEWRPIVPEDGSNFVTPSELDDAAAFNGAVPLYMAWRIRQKAYDDGAWSVTTQGGQVVQIDMAQTCLSARSDFDPMDTTSQAGANNIHIRQHDRTPGEFHKAVFFYRSAWEFDSEVLEQYSNEEIEFVDSELRGDVPV